MICLLKNLTEDYGSDKFPAETDRSKDACLFRLKHYRNTVVHSKGFTLSDKDFKKYWEHITDVSLKNLDYKMHIFRIRWAFQKTFYFKNELE